MNRELIRVNITIETDEDDLIGGFRLVDGATVWHDGPVIQALNRGAILLLDEIDLASNKILCLQSILEGNGVFLKKSESSSDQQVDSTSLQQQILKVKVQTTEDLLELTCLMKPSLNDFPVTFEQDYPSPTVESKILGGVASKMGVTDTDFCKRLVDWGDSHS